VAIRDPTMHSTVFRRVGLMAKVSCRPFVPSTVPQRSHRVAQMTYQAKNVIANTKRSGGPGLPLPSVVPEPSSGIPVDVKAYYMARGVDLRRLREVGYPSAKYYFEPRCVTFYIDENLHKYITVFEYGSVVLYNIPVGEHGGHLQKIKPMAFRPISEALQDNESYKLIIHEKLEMPSIIHSEHLNIRSLDSRNITIVSTLMAQSVAMDYINKEVDKTMEQFTATNLKIEETGKFTALKEKDLYKQVAKISSVHNSVLSKMGFFEGTDAAWEDGEYSATWECKLHMHQSPLWDFSLISGVHF
jgi:uncharacterized Rmd1/YagE family protein